jgi:hypothetical protein
MESPKLLPRPKMPQVAGAEGQLRESNEKPPVSKLINTESSTNTGAIPRGGSFKEVRTYELPDGTKRTKTKEIRFFKGRYSNWEEMFENMPFDQEVITQKEKKD